MTASMICVPNYKDRLVFIMGLGRTGLSAAHTLQKGGTTVVAWDDQEDHRRSAVSQGVPIESVDQVNWNQVAALILSPGIPHQAPQPHPAAVYARQHHIPIICDIDLLAQACSQARYLGITGTNGKSTTTALIGHLLQALAVPYQVGGNIGTPVLGLDPLSAEGRYVLELSSYQLELSPHLSINTAVWLNISPDHLERHGGLQGYVAAKARIFKPRGESQNIAIGVDDEQSQQIYEHLCQDPVKIVVPVSISRELARGIFVQNGTLVDTYFGGEKGIDLSSLPSLKGLHNWQNIALAYAAIRLEKLPFHVEALHTFKGLEHRQELCGQRDGIQFFNDSKATNIDSTLKALPYYDNIYLILGGQPKATLLDGINAHKDRIQGTYLIGEAAGAFSEILQKHGIRYTHCGILRSAVEQAFADAQASALTSKTILLSPACASFDQFKSFEDRGEQFKNIVQQLVSHCQV